MLKQAFAVLTLTVSTSFLLAADENVKLKVSEMHLCCGACTSAVEKAVKSVEGASVTVSEDEGTAEIAAKDKETAQKAIDAMAKAGFHGKLDSDLVAFKKVEPPEGTVESLELEGIHNCCGGCNAAIKEAIGKVDGIKSTTLAAKKSSFTASGKFDAKELVNAMLAAGFHCTVKDEAK